MRIRTMLPLLLLALTVGCASTGARDPRPGDVLYVSCFRPLPLQATPSAFSSDLGTLHYGADVTVVEVAAVAGPAQRQLPKWAKVQSGSQVGYLPLSSLVSQRLLERQARGNSKAKSQADSQGIKRGFSEDEKPDLAAMKGAAGSGRSGEANYPALDTLIQAHKNDNPRQDHATFRREGKLAEFNK